MSQPRQVTSPVNRGYFAETTTGRDQVPAPAPTPVNPVVADAAEAPSLSEVLTALTPAPPAGPSLREDDPIAAKLWEVHAAVYDAAGARAMKYGDPHPTKWDVADDDDRGRWDAGFLEGLEYALQVLRADPEAANERMDRWVHTHDNETLDMFGDDFQGEDASADIVDHLATRYSLSDQAAELALQLLRDGWSDDLRALLAVVTAEDALD